LGLAWRQLILGRKALMPFLFAASLTTAVYVLLPSISPDQIWAMRRFLPVTIPALIVTGVLLVEWAVDRWSIGAQRRSIYVAAVVLLVLVPGSFAWPLRSATAHRGMHTLTLEVCDALPSNSALLILSQTQTRVFQAAVRSFCGVPVAGILEADVDVAAAVEAARANWAAENVVLYVGDVWTGQRGSMAFETRYQIPEIVLTRRPERAIDLGFGIEIAPAVPPRADVGG
jgi:hypothetical protein